MKKIIICAMESEAEHLRGLGFDVCVTGVGVLNVINSLSSLLAAGKVLPDDQVINVGYAGSTVFKAGEVVSVRKSRRYNQPKAIKEQEFFLKTVNGCKKAICLTSDDFVEEKGSYQAVDMELAYICAFFNDVISLKIISDNGDYLQYKKFNEAEAWKKVNLILRRLNENN